MCTENHHILNFLSTQLAGKLSQEDSVNEVVEISEFIEKSVDESLEQHAKIPKHASKRKQVRLSESSPDNGVGVVTEGFDEEERSDNIANTSILIGSTKCRKSSKTR